MQALSFAVHIPIVCFGIAFPAFVLMLEGLWLRTGDPIYRLLAGSETLRHLDPDRAVLDLGDELLDDLEVDVGIGSATGLAHGARKIFLPEHPAAAQIAERHLQLVGERVKHRSAQVLPPRDLPLSAPDPSEVVMAEIAKIIRVIGQSPTSFAEAAQVAVREAAKTVRDIHGVHVIEMSAIVENDEITMFRTTVDIAFGVER